MSRAENSKDAVRSIALITNGAYSLPNFREPLMQAMISQGWRVFALAPDHDDYTRDRINKIGAIPIDFPMDRAGTSVRRDFMNMVKLFVILKKLQPHTIFSYFIKPVIYGSIAGWIACVPRRYALVAGLGHAFASTGIKPTVKQRALRLIAKVMLSVAFKACHGVIFQNNEDRAEFTDSGLLEITKTIRTKGTGVDLQKFSQMPLPAGPIVFLLAARLLRSKGIVEFAEAAKAVGSIHKGARFILLGGIDPNPEGLTRTEIEKLVHDAKIEWPGHVNDVTPYIARSHVFVLPSYYREGIPRSIQEALACGRAVITTDNIGCRETVLEGVNGYLVPVRDSEALANAMLLLADRIALVDLFAVQSRALAERDFDIRKINAEIISFI
jgi:glycosyltransferase involved in cell wall biosynthesis